MAKETGGLVYKRIGARPDQWAALERWRAAQAGLPSESEAVRTAIDRLTGEAVDGQ